LRSLASPVSASASAPLTLSSAASRVLVTRLDSQHLSPVVSRPSAAGFSPEALPRPGFVAVVAATAPVSVEVSVAIALASAVKAAPTAARAFVVACSFVVRKDSAASPVPAAPGAVVIILVSQQTDSLLPDFSQLPAIQAAAVAPALASFPPDAFAQVAALLTVQSAAETDKPKHHPAAVITVTGPGAAAFEAPKFYSAGLAEPEV